MSTTETAIIPAYRSSAGPASRAAGTARTAGPVRRSIVPKGACPAPTATLPAVALPAAAGADWRGRAQTDELPTVRASRRARVSTSTRPTGSRVARHLRAALTGIALAAALLAGLQLYAAQGIADARQAALEQASSQPGEAPSTAAEPAPSAPASGWVIEGTAVDAPSPLDLPRCTTSPDTPLPCLATISTSQDRAVVLEEDASLTALVRR